MYKVTLKYLAGVTAFTLVYVAAAKFGLWLVPGVQNSVTPVWPPAGIALAVILVFGYRFWPGILIGAFAITAFSGFPVTTALGIGVGNTLEAMLATYLLHAWERFIARSTVSGMYWDSWPWPPFVPPSSELRLEWLV